MGHILVGVDGSAESNRAARLAKSLACATGRGLVFTHVLPMSGKRLNSSCLADWLEGLRHSSSGMEP